MPNSTTQYTLTVHIERQKTETTQTLPFGGTQAGSSIAGHMWIELRNETTSVSAGYAPGGISGEDAMRYQGDPAYSYRTIPISETAFNILREFATPQSVLAAQNGFGPNDYNVLTNSCVDYVWKALELAGLNTAKHQGALVPMSNIDDLKRYVNLSPEEAKIIDEQIAAVLKYTYNPNADDWGRPLNELIAEWEKVLPLQPVDPLVIDLDGDGIETLSVKDGVYFDLDGIGFREAVGWVAPDDGLLVHDLDEDGAITSGKELFSNFSAAALGGTAEHGFDVLRDYDTNRDGYVDQQDKHFSRLKVWRDFNSNGASDEGELLPLEKAGVERLSVAYSDKWSIDSAGNQHRQVGHYFLRNGTRQGMTDVWFATEKIRTLASDTSIPVTPDIASLPHIHGIGNVVGLHQALADDPSGTLSRDLYSWQQARGLEREAVMDVLIQRWTHVDHLPELHADRVVTDRALAALEMFMGDQLPPQNRRLLANSNHTMTANVASAYRHLKTAVSQQLMDQTDLPFLLQDLQMTWTGQQLTWDVQPMLSRLSQRFDAIANYPDALLDLVSVLGRVRTAGLQPVVQAAQEQSLDCSGAFHEALREWGNTSEVNLGTDRGETLYSPRGESTLLFGGLGNDYYAPGPGKDLIMVRKGDGHDTLNVMTGWCGDEGRDTLVLGKGIAPDSVRLERRAYDLVIHLSEADSMTVFQYFYAPRYEINDIRFSDGSSWDRSTIAQRLTMVGTPVADYWNGLSDRPNRMEGRGGNDELNGGRYADLLDGGEGDDRLSGGAGLNILIGGRGDDALLGGLDDDVYRLSVGDGHDWIVETTATSAASNDVIEFSEGITLESLRFERVANDLLIHYGSDSDSVRLSRQFGPNPFTVEQIYLPDGSHWNLLQLIPSTAVTGG